MSESAGSDKPLLFYGLARNRRSPNRPSEPRPSGDLPGRRRSGRKTRSHLKCFRIVQRRNMKFPMRGQDRSSTNWHDVSSAKRQAVNEGCARSVAGRGSIAPATSS